MALTGMPIRDESDEPTDQAAEYRPDAGRHLTDEQHEQWKSGK